MPQSPYRAPDEDSATRAELRLDLGALSSLTRRTPFDRILITGVSGVAISLVLAAAGLPAVAGGALAVTAAVATWRWRTPPAPHLFSVAVDRGALTLMRNQTTLAERRLVDLDAVILETKTIQKVLAGNQPTPAVTHTTLSPELDVSCLVFKFADGDVPVINGHVAHYLALEWLGKTRSFLRENGWVPEDERG